MYNPKSINGIMSKPNTPTYEQARKNASAHTASQQINQYSPCASASVARRRCGGRGRIEAGSILLIGKKERNRTARKGKESTRIQTQSSVNKWDG